MEKGPTYTVREVVKMIFVLDRQGLLILAELIMSEQQYYAVTELAAFKGLIEFFLWLTK
jgi:hypothetical protein